MRFPSGVVVVDDRYAPVIVSYFVGETPLEAAQWHEEAHFRIVMDQAALGRKVVSINDATHAARPSAETRKYWAEMMERAPAAATQATVGTFVVVTNPVIRGALTAIGWMSEKVRALETFSSVEEALVAGCARLQQHGVRTHFQPSAYVPPPAARPVHAGVRAG